MNSSLAQGDAPPGMEIKRLRERGIFVAEGWCRMTFRSMAFPL